MRTRCCPGSVLDLSRHTDRKRCESAAVQNQHRFANPVELYKISKRLLAVEEFHGQTERGVKQELYAHFVLITVTRLFSNQSEARINRTPRVDHKPQLKANFKNSLLLVARNIEALMLQQMEFLTATVNQILEGIGGCRQRKRPGRSYERHSRTPEGKWRRRKPVKAM